ncbi:hypothetical protein HPB49_026269 [Dermacentor silvarum]|nr:hypothetical protein HPB49_026269 [Dermacentor silvarum]
MASQKARLQNTVASRATLHRTGTATELRALDGQRSLPPEDDKARVDRQRRQFKGDPYVTYVDVAAYPAGGLFAVAAVNGRDNSLNLAASVRAETPAAAETIAAGALVIKQHDRVYNARYEEYIDPPAGHVFSDKDKIRLVCNENLQMYCSTSDKVTVVPGGSLPENGESNGQQPSQQLTCTDGEYKLPPVPLDIKDAIDRTEPGKVSSKTKSRIVGWIANHLMTIRVYPGSLYEAASRALVLEYPALRDTIGTGWDSWKVSLRYKLGYMRKSLCTVPAVQAARVAYGKRKDTQESLNNKRHCHVTADLSQHVAAQHDAATVNSHVEFMMNEVKRPNSDMIKLRDSMLQTRPARQQWIKEMRPPTGDVLNKYPALANAEMLHEEFTALTGVKLEEKILQFINQYGNRLFELAKCRRSSKEAIAGIEAELDKLEGDEKKYRFAVGVFELLPFLLKETPRFLQGPDTYPALSFKGACAATATDIIASFEGFQVEATSASQPSPSLLLPVVVPSPNIDGDRVVHQVMQVRKLVLNGYNVLQ